MFYSMKSYKNNEFLMFVIFSANQTDLVREQNFVSIIFVKVNEEKWLTNYINNQLEFVIRK